MGGGAAMAASIDAVRRRLKRQSATRGRCRAMSRRAASRRRIADPDTAVDNGQAGQGGSRMSVPVEEPGPGSQTIGDARGPRLDSWKEIAAHLGRDVRTVQRWEARDGLPVRRLQHSKTGSVFAYAAELDAWRDARDPRAEERRPDGSAATPTVQWRRWTAVAVLVAVAAVALALVGARAGRAAGDGNTLAPLRSVAVLPLTDLSAAGESAYFADGMTEALIAQLSTASELRVIARTSVMQFRGARASASEIAKALKVDAVIEGAVHRAGNRVRITARLVRGDTQETVWSGTYDRDLPDVLTLQSEVATAILREVEVAVAPPARARPSRRPVAGDVYDAYLKARFGLNKRNRTPSDVQESIRLFEGVVARDATFAQAHAGLAAAYQASGATSIGVLPVVETIPKAAEAARRALTLDPQLGEAHRILAQADEQAWRWSAAESHYRSAIAVDANDASAHLELGAHLLYLGRTEEGLALARHGRELDPLWPDRTVRLAWLLYQARRYDEAIRELQTVLAADPDQVQALWYLGFAQIEASRFEEAVRTAERAVTVWDRNPAALALLARAYAGAGRRPDAARVIDELRRRGREGYVPPAVYVHAYLGTGDNDRALEALERAYHEHSNIVRFLKTHPLFDPIRGHARFIAVSRGVGLT
jgi:TolB-like protein/Flp pilus assembly protein TadD